MKGLAVTATGFVLLLTAATWQKVTGGVRPGISHGYDFVGAAGLALFVVGVIVMLFVELTRNKR